MNSFLLNSSKNRESEFMVAYAPSINDNSSIEWKLAPAGGCINLSECFMTTQIDVPAEFIPDNWTGPLVIYIILNNLLKEKFSCLKIYSCL